MPGRSWSGAGSCTTPTATRSGRSTRSGDENHDIFDGLSIKESTFGHDKYVPAEVVARIEEGAVHLSIGGNAVATLDDMRSAPEERLIPESSTWYQRLAWWLTGRNR